MDIDWLEEMLFLCCAEMQAYEICEISPADEAGIKDLSQWYVEKLIDKIELMLVNRSENYPVDNVEFVQYIRELHKMIDR